MQFVLAQMRCTSYGRFFTSLPLESVRIICHDGSRNAHYLSSKIYVLTLDALLIHKGEFSEKFISQL